MQLNTGHVCIRYSHVRDIFLFIFISCLKYSDIATDQDVLVEHYARANVRSHLLNILLRRSTLEIANGKTVISRSRRRKLQNGDLLFGGGRYRISGR